MAHRDVRQQQMDLSITMLGSQEALALIFKRYVFRTSECLDQDWLCVCVSTHPTNVLASGYHRPCAESKSNILQAATHQLSSFKTF